MGAAVRHPEVPSPRIRPVLSRPKLASRLASKPRPAPGSVTRPDSGFNGMGDAFSALSTLIAGMVVWGAIGYAADHFFGIEPIGIISGVLLGHFAAVYLIYVRTKPQPKATDALQQGQRHAA